MVTRRSIPAVPLDSKYTLESQPPAEWANIVTGAPSVCVLTEFRASSIRLRYLQIESVHSAVVYLCYEPMFVTSHSSRGSYQLTVGCGLSVPFQ